VARFTEAQEVYDHLGGLFLELLDDEEMAARFRKAGIVFQYQVHDPTATITLDLRPDGDGGVQLGDTSLEPDTVMKLSGDTLHDFYLGRVNASVAIAKRQITASGSVTKALRLARLIKPIIPRYRARLERAGRADLLA
jgi:putative sterol carrier protein